MRYRLAHYDLTTSQMGWIDVPDDIYRAYIGGAGLAAALLYGRLTADLDPLQPEAPLLLATGPLTGTRGPAVGRFTICGKSPATGIWGESNIGGFAGPELRSAGFDGLLLTGKAEHPVYLWISDEVIVEHNAGHLWGKADTYETQAVIKKELDQSSVKVLTIGLAGEQKLPFALILSDHGRVAGRTGMGALMGSKNLKAIAIRGNMPIPIASPESFNTLRSQVNRDLRDDLVSTGLRDFGTSSASDIFDYFGMMPKHYYSSGKLDGVERISGPSVRETILSGVSTCHGCVIACGRKVKLQDGFERKGPEFETALGFGPNLGLTDMEAITLMGERCDQLGMDTISFSNTLGLAVFLYEKGILDQADTDGEVLAWGQAEMIFRMIEATAKRQGFGAQLALGARRLAAEHNASQFAAEVKGLELAYHDPRGATGVALVYATSPRGACHNQSHYYLVEIGQTIEEIGVDMLERRDVKKKPGNVARHQDWTTFLNSLVMCIFANVPAHETVDLLNYATGWDYSLEEAVEAGERIWNTKRILNHNLGLTKEDDRLSHHLSKPLKEGGSAGFKLPLATLLESYYHERGWDATTGLPSKRTLSRLGLNEYLNALVL